MDLRTKLAISALVFSAVASASPGFAAPPNLQTPAPVIHLADNLGETSDLGWCIDTIGRGFADRLHAHSCKPGGGDVQFRLDRATGQIRSVAFEGKCVTYQPGDGVPFGLLDCSADAVAQEFLWDPETGQFRPSAQPTACLAVGEAIRSAGPFLSRDLLVAQCADADPSRTTWAIAE